MAELPTNCGPLLWGLARAGIGQKLGLNTKAPDWADWLDQPGASFVTLTKEGELRGCVGSLEAHRALGIDVRQNALAAAFHDPRFRPLTKLELDRIKVEVSVLSAAEAMEFSSKQDALDQLNPGVDGLILQAKGRRATFLPQVWEQLPTPELFVAHLLMKAGLSPGHWDGVKLWRYSVAAFQEP
ncbi:MAG: AmmeMemoRadiSam system protein A [Micrococcales bacterium]|nr:AmmeMemoRadiSam system protein A [Micrococcales bacterium]